MLALTFPIQNFASFPYVVYLLVSPSQWYFVVTCPDCKTRQALFYDPSHGQARIRQTYQHRCDKCGSEKFYEAEDIERYQHIVERRRKLRS